MSVDYLKKYITGNEFDIPALINDDLIQPVRILYNEKHYVSAAKLLLIAIDTISYIEYGDINENTFIKWLKTYGKLEELEISPEELWEQRNSLLHMSNSSSRKVASGKIRMLVFHIGKIPEHVNLSKENTGYYELHKLIVHFGTSCGKWLESYSVDRDKFKYFLERYDLIVSDSRMLHIELE
jgi:hypothetical protein